MKRSFASFLVYAQDNLENVKKMASENKFGANAQTLADNFDKLTDSEIKAISQKVTFAPLKFVEEIEGFVPTEEDNPKRKKAKKDPNAPKRNMSAYFLYSIATRSTVKKENSDADFGDLARLLSDKFKKLSPKERAKWDKAAAADKERYEKEMAKYKATKE